MKIGPGILLEILGKRLAFSPPRMEAWSCWKLSFQPCWCTLLRSHHREEFRDTGNQVLMNYLSP